MIIENVREYIMSCPELKGKKININCLGTKLRSFSIDNVEADNVIKKYCDGGVLKQAVFTLSVRDRYDDVTGENTYVTSLLEKVEHWIFKQNMKKILPYFESEELIPKSIEVTKSGYLHDTSMSNGRWKLEFRLIYECNAKAWL